MRHFLFLFLFLFSSFLVSCGSNQLGAPLSSQTNSALSDGTFSYDLENQLHLAAKLQVIRHGDGNQEILHYETPIPLQWVAKDPDRPDLGKEIQLFPKEGFQLSNLAKGNYLFRMLIFHKSENQGNIAIAKIETVQSVEKGQTAPLDFSKSSWDYQFDDDQDGFSNIAELTNGPLPSEKKGIPDEQTPWDPSFPTDPKDKESYPLGAYLVFPEKINPTSPDDQKNSKVIGELRSVQAGTLFTLIHFAADRKTIKEKINFSSKIDGSFEVSLKNSEEEDQVALVLTSKMNGDQIPDLSTDESQSFGKSMKITHRPLKMIRCRAMKGVDPIAGSGYVLLEGEGISGDRTQAEVLFPDGGSGVYASEVSISWEGSKSRELKVKIPEHAISGYPIVHVSSPRVTSGQCPIGQPIVILQPGAVLPDLYIAKVEPPFVALLGQTISVNYPIVNQGLLDIGADPFRYQGYISKDIVGMSSNIDNVENDQKIYPTPSDMYTETITQITSGLKKGEFFFPRYQENKYFVSAFSADSTKFVGPVLFKTKVGPLPGSEQEVKNNSRAAPYNTFIHYVDLKLGLLAGTINFNRNSIPVFSDFKKGPYYYTDSQILQKSDKNKTLLIGLGPLTNEGTFPMVRTLMIGQETQYLPALTNKDPNNSNDPLNTSSKIYQDAKKLYEAKDQSEDADDYKKNLATQLVEEVDLLNQKTEFPILVHVYFSAKEAFDPTDTTSTIPLRCLRSNREGCEFCINRLEQKQSIGRGLDRVPDPRANSIFLNIPLDENVLGSGNLFIVAEAIQIDPQKIIKDGIGFDYCAASDEEREKMHFIPPGITADRAVLRDFQPGDNVIKIPIQVQ